MRTAGYNVCDDTARQALRSGGVLGRGLARILDKSQTRKSGSMRCDAFLQIQSSRALFQRNQSPTTRWIQRSAWFRITSCLLDLDDRLPYCRCCLQHLGNEPSHQLTPLIPRRCISGTSSAPWSRPIFSEMVLGYPTSRLHTLDKIENYLRSFQGWSNICSLVP